MITQGLGNVAAMYAATRTTQVLRQNSETATAKNADVVHISDEARALMAQRQELDAKRAAYVDKFSPADAAKYAETIALEPMQNGPIGGLINITGLLPGGDGVLRYSGDGRPVTEESEAYFERENMRFRQERAQIYESETAKNTPPRQILEKLLAAEDSQPDRYRMMMGWTRERYG